MPNLGDTFQIAQDWGGAELDRAQQLLDQYGRGFGAMNAPSVQPAAPAPVQPNSDWLRDALMQLFWSTVGGPPNDPRAQQAGATSRRFNIGGPPLPIMAASRPAVNKPGAYLPGYSAIPQPMMGLPVR